MRHLALLLFMAFACTMRAEAEPTSIRCDGKYFLQQQPYFLTYDLEKSHFLLEFPGSNILTGEFIAADDARLDLSLNVVGGRMLLAFDRKSNVMTWPGMPAGEMGRHLLQHACAPVAGRTMLSVYGRPEEKTDPKLLDPVDPFSLSCPGRTVKYYFITLDRATKVVVLETEASARMLPGNITGIDDGVIRFTVGHGPSEQFDLLWDERSRSLTWIGVPGNPTRPTTVHECIVTSPRSIMEALARRR
jgi:hypothetical protein